MSLNDEQSIEVAAETPVAFQGEVSGLKEKNLSGIGGWLILVAIGRVLNPITILLGLVTTYLPLLIGPELKMLATPGNPAYSKLWVPVIYFEVIGNIILLLFSVTLLFLFFAKKRSFPKMMILFLSSMLLFALTDGVLAWMLQQEIAIELGDAAVKTIARAVSGAAVWIPYFVRSVRVKNTFVR